MRGLPLLLLLGCRSGGGDAADPVVVYTSVDQVFSQPVFDACQATTGLDVRAVYDTEETKSTGMVNRLITEAAHPQADVFWSNDPVRPFHLVRRGQVTPYVSPQAARFPASFKAADGTWTGFSARARILLVNTDRLGDAAAPTSIRDLTDPRWRGELAIANPLFGTTTMHVAALFDTWGDEATKGWMQGLKANQIQVASSNGEVRRLVTSGQVTVGLTDTDDAHEAVESGAHVRVIYPDADGMGTLLMPTTTVLVAGGPHPAAGQRLIDCLLSAPAESALAVSAAQMPLASDVTPPQGVPGVGEVKAMKVDYAHVSQTMERIEPWLREWVGL